MDETGLKQIMEEPQPQSQQGQEQITEEPQPQSQQGQEQIMEEPQPQQGPQDIRREIDDILNEMLADEDLYNILQEPTIHEDEGIELNFEDEIYNDIQPFDYELEIE